MNDNGWQPIESAPIDDNPCCWRCDGAGYIVVCVGDMCRGIGECIHGDGEALCPECQVSGNGWQPLPEPPGD